MNAAGIRRDFDEIARLSDCHVVGTDRYFSLLVSLLPHEAKNVLDVGCGLGRLTARLASSGRSVTGVDLSPEMISRARDRVVNSDRLRFLCCDFFEQDFGAQQFDSVLSAATFHHMPADAAVTRMIELLRPGGRLIIHDIRSDANLRDRICALTALAHQAFVRFLRTGWPRSAPEVRAAWARHDVSEKYLTFQEATEMASRLLPGATALYHWLWRYTIVWDKPRALE